MSGFLLDTNVVSELRKVSTTKADKNVAKWAKSQNSYDFYISAITILELKLGILQIKRRDVAQGKVLQTWFENQIMVNFKHKILPIEENIAKTCAELHILRKRSQHDALIAATAIVYDMTMVTRNVKDFSDLNIKIINPWNNPSA